jgi:hypothetical protein
LINAALTKFVGHGAAALYIGRARRR